MRCLVSILVPFIGVVSLQAALQPAKVFSDHMVLQRAQPNPVWGQGAAALSKVSVTLSDLATGKALAASEANADSQGAWRVELPAVAEAVATPLALEIRNEDQKISLTDVLVGDVWLCAGQSNMAHTVAHNADMDETRKYTWQKSKGWVLPNPKPTLDSGIRGMNVERIIPDDFQQPSRDFPDGPNTASSNDGRWMRAEPETAGRFTAVGFYFARAWREARLRSGENIPVGLLNIAWGGTNIETWMSERTLLSRPDFAKRRGELLVAARNNNRANLPSACYNARLHPIAGLAVRGIFWNQGETNTGYPGLYRAQLPAMIAEWRERWGNPALPFFVMQLPSLARQSKLGERQPTPPFREAQEAAVAATPGAWLVSALNLGSHKPTPANTDMEIHARQKHRLGPRLALMVRQALDGETTLLADGPRVKAVTVRDGEVRVSFETDGAGLATDDSQPLRGFEIAGADGVYRRPEKVEFADADTVVLSSGKVPLPVAVRYAWTAHGHALAEKSEVNAEEYPPMANLSTRQTAEDGARLPAHPFRREIGN